MNEFRKTMQDLGLDERKNYLVDFVFTEINGNFAIEHFCKPPSPLCHAGNVYKGDPVSFSKSLKPISCFGFSNGNENFYYNIVHGRKIDFLVKTPMDVLQKEIDILRTENAILSKRVTFLTIRVNYLSPLVDAVKSMNLFDKLMFIFEGFWWVKLKGIRIKQC